MDIDVRVVHGARAIARDALGQNACVADAAHLAKLRHGVVRNRAVGIRACGRTLARTHDAHGQLAVGELVQVGDLVARDGLAGLVLAVRDPYDLVDLVVEVAGHEGRLLVEREVVDLVLDVVKDRRALVGAHLVAVGRGARIGVGHVVSRSRNAFARHREGASGVVVAILWRAAVIDRAPLADVVDDL